MEGERNSDIYSLKGSKLKKSLKEIKAERKRREIMLPVLEDPYENTNTFKNVFRKGTAYCFLPGSKHFSPWDSKYPENPKRAVAVHEGIVSVYHRLEIVNKMIDINQEELLALVHKEELIADVKEMCEEKDEQTASLYDSIYYNGIESYQLAADAVRMTVTMAKMVAEGKVQNGFANIRPPGHHATPNVPNGYCFFNNVAIAAKYLLNEGLAEKILIVDYDVHHGQGTQRIFYETDKVLYFSIHRYEFGRFWPNLAESNFNYVGSGEGEGYNINVPLNEKGMNDFDYMSIITNILLPVAYEYNPSIILVSAGYDACLGCPEGEMEVTPAFYSHLITMLGGLAGGKILVVLEGGYFLPSLGAAALKTVEALLNDACPPLEYHTRINNSVINSINDVKIALRPYWKCFNQIDPICNVMNLTRYDKYNNHVAIIQHFGRLTNPPFPTRECYAKNSGRKNLLYEAKVRFIKDNYTNYKTCVGYMEHPSSDLHYDETHQSLESPSRRKYIMQKLHEFDLIRFLKLVEFDNYALLEGTRFPQMYEEVSDMVTRVHSPAYLRSLIEGDFQLKPDFYCNSHSKMVAEVSCTILCQLATEIKQHTIRDAVGIVRPPGHHAKDSEGSGFCILNNVAVVANYAIRELTFEKVLIVDFDVHHGDGTQELTYNKDNIMYISLHRFDQGKFFPKDTAGNFRYIGSNEAAGFNLNIPFENAKMGNIDYLNTWIKVVLPMSYAFNPDLILVSAGFDAGINDPLGGYNVHPEVFGHLIQLIKPIAPVILALEGGYNLETTALGVVNCVRALLGHPLPVPSLGDVKKQAANAMMNAIAVMKPYWPIMEVNKNLDPEIRSQNDLESAIISALKIEVNL